MTFPTKNVRLEVRKAEGRMAKVRVAEGKIDIPPIAIKPFAYREGQDISPRKIISLGGMKCFAKGFLSVTGAAGGTGKSSLAIVEELSLVYGVDLLAHMPTEHYCPFPPLKFGRQRVWSMSLEDDEEEHQRRVVAAIQHYKLDPQLLDGWYFVTYKADSPVNVASLGKDGYVISPQVPQIKRAVAHNKIDVLMVDPFVNTHSIPENDNGSMNKVADVWRSIAQELGIVTNLTHHIRKHNGMNEVSSDDLRGAVALVGAARLVRVLAPMNKEEASKLGVDEEKRRFYFWVNPSAKANITPPASSRHWFHLASVDLGNARECWESDSIGVVEYWQPTVDDSLASDSNHAKVYSAMGAQEDELLLNHCRVSSSAKDKHFSHLVANAIGLNLADVVDRNNTKNLISTWLSKGVIEEVMVSDEKRRLRPCYRMEKPKLADGDDFAF